MVCSNYPLPSTTSGCRGDPACQTDGRGSEHLCERNRMGHAAQPPILLSDLRRSGTAESSYRRPSGDGQPFYNQDVGGNSKDQRAPLLVGTCARVELEHQPSRPMWI